MDVGLLDLEGLSSRRLSEGDKVQLMVREWSVREEVTVSLFHQVSQELGYGNKIQRILAQVEQAEQNKINLPPDRNSYVENI